MTGLFETLGYDGESLRNARLHQERMENSAATLGLPFDAGAYLAALDSLVLPPDLEAIVRIELSPDGTFSASVRPYDVFDLPVRLGPSTLRVRSDDLRLRHKRTDRAIYKAAEAEAHARGLTDVVLFNEYGQATESSRFTLFVDPGDGRWRTPALACGLLPGVLRGMLLGFGVATEAVVTMDDLHSAQRLAVGNSARGLLPAMFEEEW